MGDPHDEVAAASARDPEFNQRPVRGNGRPPTRYWMTLTNLEQVIYGTIVITGVIATAPPEKYSAGAVLGLAAGTVFVFFLAHVYSRVLANAINHSPEFTVTEAVRDSQGMIECLAFPGLALLCGMFDLLSDSVAITIAEWLCVGQLFFWCLLVGRRQRRGWMHSLLTGFVFAALAAVIVVLKTLLH
ncbi:MAG: hypothetical protein ACXV3F_09045 [Frankiaceae bacterium]